MREQYIVIIFQKLDRYKSNVNDNELIKGKSSSPIYMYSVNFIDTIVYPWFL